MNEGWIKLHRCLLDKAIWNCSTPEQCKLLITILLLANHEPKQWIWEGKQFVCEAGQFITSINSLAQKTGLTQRQVRTALDKFQVHNFLTSKVSNTGRLITIVNWELYQSNEVDSDKQIDKRVTKECQTHDKPLTTNKNVRMKECKNKGTKVPYDEAVKIIGESDLNSIVQESVIQWVTYKYERKDSYTPTGLNTLIKQIQKKVDEIGADAVADVIENSICNSWKGIIWEAKNNSKPKTNDGTNQAYRDMWRNL